MRFAFICIVLFIPLLLNGKIPHEQGNRMDTVNLKQNYKYYLGGDVPSQKELITCQGLKLYFIITASCK